MAAATQLYNAECRGVNNETVDYEKMKPAVQDYYLNLSREKSNGIGMSGEKFCKKLEKKFGLLN